MIKKNGGKIGLLNFERGLGQDLVWKNLRVDSINNAFIGVI